MLGTKCPGCCREYTAPMVGRHPDVNQLCQECGDIAQGFAETFGHPWPKADHTLHARCFTCGNVEISEGVWSPLSAAETISRILYSVYACPDCRARIHREDKVLAVAV